MRTCRNQRGEERLVDSLTYRVSIAQREFIERLADAKNTGIGEAARSIIDAEMIRAKDGI